MGLANVAATFMEHLCNDDANHGYSQYGRWGDSNRGTCVVECEGHVGHFCKGDRDCSSSEADVWQEALIGTPYEGALDGATCTYNFKEAFLASGLFDWMPMSFTAQRGDIYLFIGDINEGTGHTAMCVDDGSGPYGYDALAEFSISENGTISGQVGDQTGREAYIHAYYDMGWDGILHYNGKADDEGDAVATQPVDPVTATGSRYRGQTREHGWLDWMEGTTCTCPDDCGDDFAGVEGCWLYGFEANFHFKLILMDGTETPWTMRWEDSGQAIRGICIEDMRYQAHFCGSCWGKVENGMSDGGAGDDVHALDMVRVW